MIITAILGFVCAVVGWFACRFWHGPLIEAGRREFARDEARMKALTGRS